MGHEKLEKVIEKLATSEKTTQVCERAPEGKNSRHIRLLGRRKGRSQGSGVGVTGAFTSPAVAVALPPLPPRRPPKPPAPALAVAVAFATPAVPLLVAVELASGPDRLIPIVLLRPARTNSRIPR
jgi:hypothetical protein